MYNQLIRFSLQQIPSLSYRCHQLQFAKRIYFRTFPLRKNLQTIKSPQKSGLGWDFTPSLVLLTGGPDGGPVGGVGGPDGGPDGGPVGPDGGVGGPDGGPDGGPVGPVGGVGGPDGGPDGGPVGPAGGVGGPDGGPDGGPVGPAGGVGGFAGGVGGPAGGVGGPAGGVGGPAGGVGGPAVGTGASLTESELEVWANRGSSVLDGCERGASLTGFGFRIGASRAALAEVEVKPVGVLSKSVLIRVSPPSEFSAEYEVRTTFVESIISRSLIFPKSERFWSNAPENSEDPMLLESVLPCVTLYSKS